MQYKLEEIPVSNRIHRKRVFYDEIYFTTYNTLNINLRFFVNNHFRELTLRITEI